MRLVAEVAGQLGLHGALEYGFGELLEQSVIAKNLFGRLVVFKQVNPF